MDHDYAYGMWVIAIFNIGLFLFFILSFIRPQGKVEWRNMGIVTAFLVALFTEMYGFPLTIYLLTGWLGEAYPVLQPFNHKYGHLWVVVFGGSNFAWALVMGVSLILLIMGYILMSKGWRQVHAAQGSLVTTGVYSFVRHPQYTGLFLVIVAFLIQWPTLLTVIMAPILIYAYVRLSRAEERTVASSYSDQYQSYRNRTPMFFPKLREWPDFLRAPL
ncbi:MAG: isoprenylcysteine carboxylmethyltransferase family protein [Gammaproteobacteria bacterium]|nr:isoprenylcysteine carboxylmethyltransferase family protein [Gammaproteobacteria bacterium]